VNGLIDHSVKAYQKAIQSDDCAAEFRYEIRHLCSNFREDPVDFT
jgi:hypothetical protein